MKWILLSRTDMSRYQIECKKEDIINYGSLKEWEFIYCPFCGKEIKAY